jgi:hypothetical protein
VDLIVSDMNMLPHLAAECMDPLLPFLVPGGFIILTCKLMGLGRDRCSSVSALCAACAVHETIAVAPVRSVVNIEEIRIAQQMQHLTIQERSFEPEQLRGAHCAAGLLSCALSGSAGREAAIRRVLHDTCVVE